jgi:hypothetical protein
LEHEFDFSIYWECHHPTNQIKVKGSRYLNRLRQVQVKLHFPADSLGMTYRWSLVQPGDSADVFFHNFVHESLFVKKETALRL